MNPSSGTEEGCRSWYLCCRGENPGRHSAAAAGASFEEPACQGSGVFLPIWDHHTLGGTFQTERTPERHFSATLGEEPEVELALL